MGMTDALNAKYCFKGKVNEIALTNYFISKAPSVNLMRILT